MNAIFRKLNYKAQEILYVLQAPASFERDMNEMASQTTIKTSLTGARKIDFVVAFVTRQKEVNDAAAKIIPALADDGVVWLAYPKGTSKKYTCEFNRDTGWAVWGDQGFEGVRMVAIDEDWSALRFRRAVHIKNNDTRLRHERGR